jgi:hypothetical protein
VGFRDTRAVTEANGERRAQDSNLKELGCHHD